SMRGHWRPDAGELWRIGLQRLRRNLRRTAFHCARVVWVFSQFVQPDSGRYARRRSHRNCAIALALVTGFCIASLVRMEVSEFYRLADRASIAAPDLLAVPQTNRGRTTLFRSHAIAALDDVDLIFRFDCRADLRNAPRANRFEETRCALPRSWTGCDRAVISSPSSLRKLCPARVRFFRELT